jgi:hypothetical protein
MTQAVRDSRATLLRIITFLGGIYFFLYFITPESALEAIGVKSAHESISNGFIVVGSMAIGLGIINLLASHGSRLIFLKRGWFFSLALLCGLFIMIGVTIGQWLEARATAREISRVSTVGDFATRIVEDAKAGAGKERSYSPSGAIPELRVRVGALLDYADTEINRIESDGVRAAANGDQALQVLLAELREGATALKANLLEARGASWSELTPANEELLGRLSRSAAKLGSTYGIIKRKDGARSLISRLYEFLYNGLFNHLGSSMFALLGVYIAAAAYRAFRVRSVESALMMGAALVVMLGQISFGAMIYDGLPAIRQWLLEVPNSAAFRAIRLGAGVAGLMLAVRMWLSLETRAKGDRNG